MQYVRKRKFFSNEVGFHKILPQVNKKAKMLGISWDWSLKL